MHGLGIFLAPGFLSADDLEAGRLVPLLPDYRPVELAINAFNPHRHLVAAKVRAFLDLLAARILDHRRWFNPGIPASAAAPLPAGD